MGSFWKDREAKERQQKFWRLLPEAARVAVDVPLPDDAALMFTDAQERTIGALGILLGSDRFDVSVTVVARSVQYHLPVGVFTVTRVNWIDEGNGPEPVRLQNRAVYLHPNGALRSFYYPAL